MAIAEYVRAELIKGNNVLIGLPQEFSEVWDMAKAEDLPVRDLFLLRDRPPKGIVGAYAKGAFERDTGDIWLWYAPDKHAEMRMILLHEIAHAGSGDHRQDGGVLDPHTTITEEYDKECDNWRKTRELGRRWGLESWFTEQHLAEQLQREQEQHQILVGASALAGNKSLRVANTVIEILARQRVGWTTEMITGLPSRPALMEASVDFDRTLLRPPSSWAAHNKKSSSFGALEVPQSVETAHYLREALAIAADLELDWKKCCARAWDGEGKELGYFEIELATKSDLGRTLAVITSAFLDLLMLQLEASWYCEQQNHGDRTYSVGFTYIGGTEPLRALIKMTIKSTDDEAHLIEAALQRYIHGWHRRTPIV